MRDTAKKIFGEDVVNQTVDTIGLDKEYELLGHYRPSGYHGVRIIFSHPTARI